MNWLDTIKDYWALIVAGVALIITFVRQESKTAELDRRLTDVELDHDELESEVKKQRDGIIRTEQNQQYIIKTLETLSRNVEKLLDRTARLEGSSKHKHHL